MEIIDFHTHTFFSDGILSPAELVYSCKRNGCVAVALTDHADYSNLNTLLDAMKSAAPHLEKHYGLKVIPGVELTYIPPEDIGRMVSRARNMGAEVVLVHGETPAENVPPGTNSAALRAGCDILAHPGRLTDEEAETAVEMGVLLEITTRRGHREGNRGVLEKAEKAGARVILNTDSHGPEDLLDRDKIKDVLKRCGKTPEYYSVLRENAFCALEKIRGERK